MLVIWVLGGLFVLAGGLVSAELATRFPRAGGEYVFLREAYGDFTAFFFGWGYSVFIVGGGAASIAAASGEAATEVLGLDPASAGSIGALFIVAITCVNALGLEAGAGLQNALTGTKIAALLAIAVVAFSRGGAATDWSAPVVLPQGVSLTSALATALVPVLFAYAGTTDSIKLAEEIKDVRRDLPRALILSAVALMALYLAVNVAFLGVLTPAEMARATFVGNDVMDRVFGGSGRRVMSALSLVVFLGALSATVLATVRVTFALARDGLTFRFMSKMSSRQAPIAALLVVGGIATSFTLFRGFQQILNIYFLASTVLFGLAYGSLIVFRVRDRTSGRGFPPNTFRCPAGPLLATLLILFQVSIAVPIMRDNPTDSLYTLLMLGVFALLYVVWTRVYPRDATSGRGGNVANS